MKVSLQRLVLICEGHHLRDAPAHDRHHQLLRLFDAEH